MNRNDRARFWASFTVCFVLALVSTFVLSACTTTPPAELPAELPHYPCERQEGGKTVYFACSADEWLHQIITRKERP